MKVSRHDLIFYSSYVLLFISLFLGDVNAPASITSIARMLRWVAYITILLRFLLVKLKSSELVSFLVFFSISIFYLLMTRDLYWSILLMYIYSAREIKAEKIIKLSYYTLIIGTFFVVFLNIIGVLPDVLTLRNQFSTDMSFRHSIGFYHSNVLPLIIMYLEVYYVFISKEKAKIFILLLFVIISIFLYTICNSRNAFFLSLIISACVILHKTIGINKIYKKVLYYLTKYSVLLLCLFSYIVLFLFTKLSILYKIDDFFSGRFRLGYIKMNRVGIHLINLMSNADFFSDSASYVNGLTLNTVVLDNGYIYVLLRYGVAIALVYVLISILLTNKTKDSAYCLIALLVVFVANFIDNDLVDYSFLPFVLYAFAQVDLSKSKKLIIERIKKKEK